MANQQPTRAVGIFEDQQHAVNAVHALTQAGFSPQQIVVVARDWKGHELPGPMIEAQHAADNGAVTGALVGASLGVAAGAVISLIPGLGVAVIVLSAIGGLTGAAVGAYAGPFIALEMTEAEAQEHAEHVEQGRTVVVVKTADRQSEAESIMVEHGAYDFSMAAQPRTTVAPVIQKSEKERLT
jgi:outer membrane lipoprotein SlyB